MNKLSFNFNTQIGVNHIVFGLNLQEDIEIFGKSLDRLEWKQARSATLLKDNSNYISIFLEYQEEELFHIELNFRHSNERLEVLWDTVNLVELSFNELSHLLKSQDKDTKAYSYPPYSISSRNLGLELIFDPYKGLDENGMANMDTLLPTKIGVFSTKRFSRLHDLYGFLQDLGSDFY